MTHRRSRIERRKSMRQTGAESGGSVTSSPVWEIEIGIVPLVNKAISTGIGILLGGILEKVLL